MSYITDVTMIVRDPYPQAIVDHVQSFTWGKDGELARVAHFGKADTSVVGGSKVYCDDVYLAAFNYLPVADFLEHLSKAPWNPYSHSVVLIRSEGDYYAIFRPGEDLVEDES